MKIDLCTTAYNECENLVEFINGFIELKNSSKSIGSLVLVENGSIDNSLEVLTNMDCDALEVFPLKVNRRFGGGMKFAIQSANSKYVALLPADNQYSFLEVSELIDEFVDATKVNKKILLKGKRIKRSDPVIIRCLSNVYSIFVSLLIGQRILDVNGLPKIFDTTAFLDIIDGLPEDASFDAALLREVHKAGFRIEERDISYLERKNGLPSWHKGRFIIGFKMIKSLIVYRFFDKVTK